MSVNDEQLSKAYQTGKCRDCGSKIQSLGPSSRCEPCDEKFTDYINSHWGLDSLIEERNRNQGLGLCFFCGGGLEDPYERMCSKCQSGSEHGEWSRSMYRRGRQTISDRNPYVSVWDPNEVDNAVHLASTYGSLAQQTLAKAKFFQKKAERGGPRGRAYIEEARSYIRITAKLLEKEKDVRKNSR